MTLEKHHLSFLKNLSNHVLGKWVWLEADLPYGSKTRGKSRSVTYPSLTCLLFHQSDIGRLGTLQLIDGKTYLRDTQKGHIITIPKGFFPHYCLQSRGRKPPQNSHLPQWHERKDPIAWWSCSSCHLLVLFCNLDLGSHHQSDIHLPICRCCVFSALLARTHTRAVHQFHSLHSTIGMRDTVKPSLSWHIHAYIVLPKTGGPKFTSLYQLHPYTVNGIYHHTKNKNNI